MSWLSRRVQSFSWKYVKLSFPVLLPLPLSKILASPPRLFLISAHDPRFWSRRNFPTVSWLLRFLPHADGPRSLSTPAGPKTIEGSSNFVDDVRRLRKAGGLHEDRAAAAVDAAAAAAAAATARSRAARATAMAATADPNGFADSGGDASGPRGRGEGASPAVAVGGKGRTDARAFAPAPVCSAGTVEPLALARELGVQAIVDRITQTIESTGRGRGGRVGGEEGGGGGGGVKGGSGVGGGLQASRSTGMTAAHTAARDDVHSRRPWSASARLPQQPRQERRRQPPLSPPKQQPGRRMEGAGPSSPPASGVARASARRRPKEDVERLRRVVRDTISAAPLNGGPSSWWGEERGGSGEPSRALCNHEEEVSDFFLRSRSPRGPNKMLPLKFAARISPKVPSNLHPTHRCAWHRNSPRQKSNLGSFLAPPFFVRCGKRRAFLGHRPDGDGTSRNGSMFASPSTLWGFFQRGGDAKVERGAAAAESTALEIIGECRKWGNDHGNDYHRSLATPEAPFRRSLMLADPCLNRWAPRRSHAEPTHAFVLHHPVGTTGGAHNLPQWSQKHEACLADMRRRLRETGSPLLRAKDPAVLIGALLRRQVGLGQGSCEP